MPGRASEQEAHGGTAGRPEAHRVTTAETARILFVLYTGIRWEFLPHEAFLRLACAIICLGRLTSLSPC
jgi:hypothetical protein